MKHLLLLFALFSCCTPPKIKPLEYVDVVVKIEQLHNDTPIATGSGIIIDAIPAGAVFNIAVLTAKHNLEDLPVLPEYSLVVKYKGIRYQVIQRYLNTDHDAAVLVFESKTRPQVAQMDSSEPTPLTEITTAGYPLGMELTVAAGLLNYKLANELGLDPDSLWLCTAPTYMGNSGGGIFSKDTNKLIGISLMAGTHQKQFDYDVVTHLHIFIPISVIQGWLDEVSNEREKVQAR